jgi:hypothetical protein
MKYLDFISTFNLLDESECNFVQKFILEQEPKIKQLGPDIYPGTSSDSLTGRFRYYNLLDFDQIEDIFIPKLKKVFEQLNWKLPVTVQCWANVFRKNESIERHHHGPGYYSSHLFISGDESLGTTYIINGEHCNVPNIPGSLCIFSSELEHYSIPNIHENRERITIAMDIFPGELRKCKQELYHYYWFN